jgi:hypothetical protein
MNLDESQRKKVGEWIAQGLKLSDIQNRLASELGIGLTYMDVRLLVDDLKLTPKDVEPAKAAQVLAQGAQAGAGAKSAQGSQAQPIEKPTEAAAGVFVSVDEVTRPGAMASGKVQFSDGVQAGWYLDETGRLGLIAQQQGYRPAAADMQQFQIALERELSKLGL